MNSRKRGRASDRYLLILNRALDYNLVPFQRQVLDIGMFSEPLALDGPAVRLSGRFGCRETGPGCVPPKRI